MSGRSRVGNAASVRLEVECLENRLLLSNYPLSSLPALSSLPGAKATLYLDFNGHFQAVWGAYKNINTPAYDQDGDRTTFNDAELASIEEIWRYVAEDYAPFNINVTTVNPGAFGNGKALRVAIGGSGNWLGTLAGGFAYVNSFVNSIPNVSFVFAKNLGNGLARYTAEAASHEAGHAFGLQHQRLFSGNKLIDEYNPGSNGRAPIMGSSYLLERGVWWNGTTNSPTSFQDDLTVLTRAINGFGYRPDEHGDSASLATPLTINGDQATSGGIIGSTADLDWFAFATGAGEITFTVTVPAPYNNLDAVLQLYDVTGQTLIASSDPDDSFSATFTVAVAEGAYRLVVSSNGFYGDIGQYTLSGTIVPSANVLQAPGNLSAGGVSAGRIDLSWFANDGNADGYIVRRSIDGVIWDQVGDIAGSLTAFSDVTVAPLQMYKYVVSAYNLSLTSDLSNQVQAAFVPVKPLPPTNLVLVGLVSGEVDLSWTDKSDNETSFRIERRLIGKKWKVIGTVNANTTFFEDTSVMPKKVYKYRVRAMNDLGASAPTNVLKVKSLPGGMSGGVAASLALPADVSQAGHVILGADALASFGDVMRSVARIAERGHFGR